MTDGISPKQFHESEGVEEWRVIGDGACAYFRTGSFAAGARLVEAISHLPGVEDHKPDVDLRPDGVTVRLITYTHDYYGMSQRDVESRVSTPLERTRGGHDDLGSVGLLAEHRDVGARLAALHATAGDDPSRREGFARPQHVGELRVQAAAQVEAAAEVPGRKAG